MNIYSKKTLAEKIDDFVMGTQGSSSVPLLYSAEKVTSNNIDSLVYALDLRAVFSSKASYKGSQISGFSLAETVRGAQIGLLGSGASDLRGFQFGGLVAGADVFSGFQLGALVSSEDSKGFQLGLLIATSWHTGVQIGLRNRVGEGIKGVQLGLINSSEALKGAQVGFFNVLEDSPREKPKGIQFGVLNAVGEIKGLQVGLVNYIQANPWYRRILPFINWGN